MKKLVTCTILCLMFILIFIRTSLAQTPKFTCGTTDSSMMLNFTPDSATLSSGMFDSRYGGVFTARDTLRFLIVYCGFTNDDTDAHALYENTSIWPWDSVAPRDAKKMFYKNFNQFDVNSNDFNISNFYFQMSRHANKPFKVIAETFPHRIDVTATNTINNTQDLAFQSYTQMAFDTMQKYYPNYNWSKFDTRKNRPNFSFDNSDNLTYPPDNKIDYLIAIWRYDKSVGVYGTSIIDSHNGFVGVPNYNFINTNNDTVATNAGFTICIGVADSVSLMNSFIHEVAHTLYDAPHTFAANDVVGKHFVNTDGWGMMHGYMPTITQCANSWERWYNGWSEITYDLSHSSQNGNYTIGDYITTGDIIRIKIPHVEGQYIWLENHQNKHKFDSRLGWNVNGLNDSIPSREKGVLAFVENIAGQRSDAYSKVLDTNGKETYVSIFDRGANGLRALSREGNGEYLIDSSFVSPQWWNNTIYDFNRVADNAVGIYGNNSTLRFDYNNNNVIKISTGANSAPDNEQSYVVYMDNDYKYSRLGANLTFLENDELSLSSKTVPVNYSTFNNVFRIPSPPDYLKLSPTYINGISIKIINYDSLGNANIEIKFNNYNVNNDTRWCGDIILSKNTTNSTFPSLNLISNKSILIDKAITPNRTSKINGQFINPTIFICKQSAFVKLNSESNIIVDHGSTFKMESTSKLEINSGAILNIKNNSILSLSDSAQIIVKEGGKILIEKGSTVQLNGKAKIILEAPTSIAQLNSTIELKGTSILVLNGTSKVIAENKSKIHVKDTAQFNITANAELQYDNGATLILENTKSSLGFDGGIRIGNGTQFTFSGSGYIKVSQSTGQFIPGSNSSVRISGSGNTDQIIDILNSGELSFSKRLAQLTIFNGKITMDNLSKVSVYCKARIASTKFTSWDGNPTTHKGLNLYGQGGVYISSCTFEKGANGIYNSYKPSITRQGGKLYISSSVFQDLTTAYYQYGGGFGIFNSEFTNNNDGIITNITEVNSELNNCEFSENTGYAIRFIGTGTASLSLNGTNISGSAKGIFSFGNSQTNIKCGTFTNNTSSVFGYFDPSFNLSSELNKNGTVTFNNEGQIFSFYHAGDLFLAEGFNNFYPASSGNNEIINGTQNRFVPSSLGYFNAYNNDWNGSGNTPVYSSDYEVTSSETSHFSDQIYYQDADPIMSAIECGTGEPCSSCEEADLNPFKNCDCETINTTNIVDLPLNTALQNIIDDLSTSTGIDDREESVVKLKELLTYSMSAINDEERFLLKYAYRMFKDELALCISDTNFVDSTALSTNVLLNDYMGYFSDILTYQKELPTSDQLFDDISILTLDEALSYKLLTDQTQALDKTDDLFAIVDEIKYPYIAYWTCLLSNEVDFKAGTITQEDFESYSSGCWAEFTANYEGMNRAINNNTIQNSLKSYSPKNTDKERNDATSQNNSENKSNSKDAKKELNIYPNPTTNSFTLNIPEESANTVIRVFNMYGIEVLEQIITNKNNVTIDLINQVDGYYICSVITSNSKYEAKIIKIK